MRRVRRAPSNTTIAMANRGPEVPRAAAPAEAPNGTPLSSNPFVPDASESDGSRRRRGRHQGRAPAPVKAAQGRLAKPPRSPGDGLKPASACLGQAPRGGDADPARRRNPPHPRRQGLGTLGDHAAACKRSPAFVSVRLSDAAPVCFRSSAASISTSNKFSTMSPSAQRQPWIRDSSPSSMPGGASSEALRRRTIVNDAPSSCPPTRPAAVDWVQELRCASLDLARCATRRALLARSKNLWRRSGCQRSRSGLRGFHAQWTHIGRFGSRPEAASRVPDDVGFGAGLGDPAPDGDRLRGARQRRHRVPAVRHRTHCRLGRATFLCPRRRFGRRRGQRRAGGSTRATRGSATSLLTCRRDLALESATRARFLQPERPLRQDRHHERRTSAVTACLRLQTTRMVSGSRGSLRPAAHCDVGTTNEIWQPKGRAP